jgi:hypothetical protein
MHILNNQHSIFGWLDELADVKLLKISSICIHIIAYPEVLPFVK